MTATRRLAAILAADVAGYSRLIGSDEGGTLQALKAIRAELIDPTIAAHNGRLVKTTGDGLLVEFGSVVDALSCATEVQAGMAQRNTMVAADKRIDFRIGINMGDIVVEDGDIFGDGVNVAARLEALAEPGGICVSARVQEDAAGKLDLSFEDLGEQNLKNIARPVRAFAVRLSGEATKLSAGKPPLPLPDKPSIAVLAFNNMSIEPDQEVFADGIAEDIITALSRYPSLFVIARNSSFTYKGRTVDVKEIGRDLGVRYVLEGSLRRAGNRIRVTAQLVEAETGKHVWAERYDRDLADIFAMQDEITEAVTIAVGPTIADIELHRAMRTPPESLDAWAAYQRGLWHLAKTTANDYQLAENFFCQAIDLDRNFPDGYCGLATAQLRGAGIFRTRDFAQAQSSAERLARMAIALDGSNAFTHSCLSFALFVRGDHRGALAEADLAVALSPNLAAGYFQKGSALIYSGRPQEGLIALQTSLRLEPRGSNLAPTLHHVAVGLYFSRSYHQAVEAAQHLIRSFPEHPSSYRWLAAAFGQLGCATEAQEALGKAMAIARASHRPVVRHRPPWHRPEDHAHMLEGLRKAGMPEE
jgi:adenylate cyclase